MSKRKPWRESTFNLNKEIGAVGLNRKMYGRLDWFLLMFGFIYLVIGYSYTGRRPTDALYHALDVVVNPIPLWAFGALWMVFGGVAIVSALLPKIWSRPLGFFALGTMPSAWGFVYMASFIVGDNPRGWVSAVIYWAFAVAVTIVSGMVDSRAVRRSVGGA